MNYRQMALALMLSYASGTYGETVPKADWLEGMRTIIPTYFCSEQQYFWECFDVSVLECEEAAAAATRICINDRATQIPDVLELPREGELWGSRIGQCAGLGYEARMANRRIDDPVCADPRNWGAQ